MFTKVATTAVLLLSSCVALSQSREGDALEHADANKDGKITRQEYIDARAAQFARMDRNGDGVVDETDSRERAGTAGAPTRTSGGRERRSPPRAWPASSPLRG